MDSLAKIKNIFLGQSRDPFSPQIFKTIALAAFFAWIGLGADSLSSSCYGPEVAFIELGKHTHLAIFIAAAISITVFIIALGYIQVIQLFPTGGGGYKVAGVLLHPYAGLVAGSALIVDYVFTITISVTSGVNAIFSFLPTSVSFIQLEVQAALIFLLLILNLRGIKESILILLPIFLGFVFTHFALIIYGIFTHHQGIGKVVHVAMNETQQLTHAIGWVAVVGLTLHAYSLGAGTYTGLEAVANNVNRLAEPRIRTGKWTMLYLAVSLSFTAGGLILAYLLWQVTPVTGKTLNAVLFEKILGHSTLAQFILFFTLLFETGILFVAASSGFITGPAILANMAIDGWVPRRFQHLSNRLTIQNGIIFFGIAAFALLLWTRGNIHLLVVLYSINVFINFTLAFLGISVYWWFYRKKNKSWFGHFIFTVFGLIVVISILLIMIVEKFSEGAWLTLCVTAIVILVCLLIKKHYNNLNRQLEKLNDTLAPALVDKKPTVLAVNPLESTAAIFISENRGLGMHVLLSCLKSYPNQFKNFIFLSSGIVDLKSFRGRDSLMLMREKVEANLQYFVEYCQQHNLPATSYATYGTDVINGLSKLSDKVGKTFSDVTYFVGQLVLINPSWFSKILNDDISELLKKNLSEQGKQVIIVPLRIFL